MRLQAVGYALSFGQGPKTPKNTTELLRERLLQQSGVKMSDSFTEHGRLSEFELNKLIKYLTKYIDLFEPIQKDAYRGESLYDKPLSYLANLKSMGVHTIIDLSNKPLYDHMCNDEGLIYHPFEISFSFWTNAAFRRESEFLESRFDSNVHRGAPNNLNTEKENFSQESRAFIEKFIAFINTVQKGNFYIGCSYGNSRTDQALMLCYFFNPRDAQFRFQEPDEFSSYIPSMNNLYKKLNAEDKIKLGWTPEFEEKFKARLQKAKNGCGIG